MKRINLFWIIWIFVTLEFKDVACVSYPGVYRNELPLIVPGASPIENVFVTERYGINYECIETCYPILSICDDKCSIMPDLPECSQCQRLPVAQPTPIIIETPPYEPRPPYFEHPVKPIVPYPSRVPRPRPIFRQPPRPIIPQIPRPPEFEVLEPVPPTPILPDIPLSPELEIFDLPPPPILFPVPEPPVFELIEPESPPQLIFFDISSPPTLEDFETEMPTLPTVPDVPPPPVFEHFQPELPPKLFVPDVPRPPQLEVKLPEVPRQLEPVLPPPLIVPEFPLSPELEPIIPTIPEFLRPPQFEIDLIPQPMLPDMEIYSQFQLLEPDFPQKIIPYIPLPPQFEQFEREIPWKPVVPDFPMIDVPPPPPISEVPFIIMYESPPTPEILHPTFVQIPNPISPQNVFYPEETLYVPEVQPIYDSEEAGLVIDQGILHPPIVIEYQDICNDYCLLKRNISECEICLKTGVPADHLELCSNCLVNPSEPDCELCYPILLNLCREFCIFEENEPDCSICYPQPLIERPVVLTKELINIPAPILPTTTEYVPVVPQEMCPEYCVLTPTSPECEGCVVGVDVVEKVCVDIYAGYCLENPNDEQCAVCYSYSDIIETNEGTTEALPTLEIINYQCCYGDYCTPMPRNGICPVVCKELCTTACSNDCFNPTCPDCQEVVAMNELRRTQFMIWLKSKLSDMKSRYMAMIEACIRRTELMYERELQAIEVEVDTSFLLA